MEKRKQEDLTTEITGEMEEPQSADFVSNQLELQMEDHVMIDIEQMIRYSEDGLLSSACCIYRAPTMMRKIKEEAYTPMIVSIGPFHHGDLRLQDMERHKQVLFKRFTRMIKASMNEMVSLVKCLEPKVRASYSENFFITRDELVMLLLMDAAFIIELFRSYYCGEIFNDAKLSQPYLHATVKRDLLLLENQLPFFLIEDLYNRAFPLDQRGDLPSFLELTFHYFSNFNKQEIKPNANIRINHFTDLFRLFYLPRIKPERKNFEPGDLLLKYSANELQEAGVKLKVSSSECLLDLKFSGRFLEVPQILVNDTTEVLFRNMIALEHCSYPFESYITDYIVLLNSLIRTYKDVDILIQKTIVRNYMDDYTSSGVARLFTDLKRSTVCGTCSTSILEICRELNGFYEKPLNKKKAALLPSLKRDYCSTPWKTVATIGGILLLILTLIQTIFAVLK